jgi:L-arabinose isomerase
LTQTREGRLKFLAAEGESLPGERLQLGNTDSRLRFGLGPAAVMEAWCKEGPTHHFALGVGHITGSIEKVVSLLGLELKVIDQSLS